MGSNTNRKSKYRGRLLSFLVLLATVLSLFVFPASAAVQINPSPTQITFNPGQLYVTDS